ncbi:MAG: aspartate ammonia-lyase [Alphaproteobacteria bacterium]
MTKETRDEEDSIGVMSIAKSSLSGIHTARAVENFPLSHRVPHSAIIHAYGHIKLAGAQTNKSLGFWKDEPQKVQAIERACEEMIRGDLDEHIIVDALQGGAGTSTNMNVNEVLANRALILLQKEAGDYDTISPLNDINLHQSTNDTYPTALKLAAITLIKELEENVSLLVEAFQKKEQDFVSIVKIGRTQMQDAVPTTLGRTMSAYAEAFGRDRWRIYKCEERLRVVNLGGTAIGTGLGAPRDYIFRVVDNLRANTGIGFARAENMVDNTQNADVFVEVSGILKALASSLVKCATDLRLMSSGPDCGFGEISLPAMQAGSSIMPHKINPVIPEAVTQAAIRYMGYDHEITMAASMGNLELNAFLPLVADSLLHGIDLLNQAVFMLRVKCVEGIVAREHNLQKTCSHAVSIGTALVPKLGYMKVARLMEEAANGKKTIKEIVLEKELLTKEEFASLTSPEALMKLGY